jgi:alkylated DNA repair dioxygenase AlkB
MSVKINYITQDNASWLIVGNIGNVISPDDFQKLWSLCPQERGKIKPFGKIYDVPRYLKSFIQDYRFSGLNHKADPLPDEFEPYLVFANNLIDTLLNINNVGYQLIKYRFNQCLINWYPTGLDYIGKHSDDENPLVTNSPIFSLTIYNPDQEREIKTNPRIFRLKAKPSTTNSTFLNNYDIKLEQGMYIIMGGTTQKTHTHEVPKTTKMVAQRINITFRCFK